MSRRSGELVELDRDAGCAQRGDARLPCRARSARAGRAGGPSGDRGSRSCPTRSRGRRAWSSRRASSRASSGRCRRPNRARRARLRGRACRRRGCRPRGPAKRRIVPSSFSSTSRMRLPCARRRSRAHAARERERLGVIGDRDVRATRRARRVGHLLERALAVGLGRVHVEIAAARRRARRASGSVPSIAASISPRFSRSSGGIHAKADGLVDGRFVLAGDASCRSRRRRRTR